MKALVAPMLGINEDTVEKQHMKMNIQVQRTAKALNQGHAPAFAMTCQLGLKLRLTLVFNRPVKAMVHSANSVLKSGICS